MRVRTRRDVGERAEVCTFPADYDAKRALGGVRTMHQRNYDSAHETGAAGFRSVRPPTSAPAEGDSARRAGSGLRSTSRLCSSAACDLGRLAIGLVREAGSVQYWGFDASEPWIAWCRKHIERSHPSFRFVHVNIENELYNPAGTTLGDDFRFPLADGHADIVYMWGVFTNMRLNDARIYISEISRLLRNGGRAFLTAFVEKNVEPESINPVGYVDYECKVPLHVVRYAQDVLFSMFAEHGLTVEEFAYHGGTHCNQSEIYLRKVGGPVSSPRDQPSMTARRN